MFVLELLFSPPVDKVMDHNLLSADATPLPLPRLNKREVNFTLSGDGEHWYRSGAGCNIIFQNEHFYTFTSTLWLKFSWLHTQSCFSADNISPCVLNQCDLSTISALCSVFFGRGLSRKCSQITFPPLSPLLWLNCRLEDLMHRMNTVSLLYVKRR